MKNILIALLVLTAVLTGGRAFSDETTTAPSVTAPDGGQSAGDAAEAQGQGDEAQNASQTEKTDYSLPPEIYTWLGYNFFDLQGSRKAAEYEYPYSSIVGGLKMTYVPLPSRWEADLDWDNPNSWAADASYGFRDILKISYTGWALWRNYNHFGLIGLTTNKDKDPGANYFTDDQDNRLSLVLKWPDRPYHVFVNLRQFEKDGTVQARFYEGSNVKGSRSRDIDWITRDLTAGINGHFGPIEAQYSHTVKTFDPHKDVALVDLQSGNPDSIHSVVPEFEENSDSVMVHTDYTGRISADAQFINGERDNEHSRAQLDYKRAYGDFNLIPLPGLTMVVRYRFNRTNESVPDSVTANGGTGFPKNPIDFRDNTAQVAFRYNPITILAFKAQYSFDNVKRYNANLWSNQQLIDDHILVPFGTIPSVQDIHRVTLGMTSNPARWVNFKGTVEYTHTDEPAHPLDPKNFYQARVDANFMPTPEITSNVHYRFNSGDNDQAAMHTNYENPGIQAVWSPAGPITLSVNYDYFMYKIKRDIVLFGAGNVQYPVERAPYTDQSHVYSIGGTYTFHIPLELDAEFHQTFGSGSFRVDETLGSFNTEDVGELADLAVRETGGRITGRYTLPKNWALSLTYDINNYFDFKNKPQDGPQNGTAQSVMIVASKKW